MPPTEHDRFDTSVAPLDGARHLVVAVVKVRDESAVRVGQTFELDLRRVLVGRGAGADVRLNDQTVSREHAVIEATDAGLVLRNLSARGATFVDKERVPSGGSVSLDPHEAHVQIGRVLLRIRGSQETRVYQSAMSIDAATHDPSGTFIGLDPPVPPFLGLRWDAGRCHVRLKGRLLSLYPAAAAVLAALCEAPGQPVHRFDIEEALGEAGSVDQQVSTLRRILAEQVEAGVLELDELRDRIRAHSTGAHVARLDEMDARELLRCFVASRRGYGYVLCVGPDDVRVDDGAE